MPSTGCSAKRRLCSPNGLTTAFPEYHPKRDGAGRLAGRSFSRRFAWSTYRPTCEALLIPAKSYPAQIAITNNPAAIKPIVKYLVVFT